MLHMSSLTPNTYRAAWGARQRAAAKTDGEYALLTPLGFSQKLIENAGTDSTTGTTVDIYYKALDSYRVIFDTDYTYIRRQQIALDDSVKFKEVATPTRKGYILCRLAVSEKGRESG